jgi:hypothetical protein
MAAEKAIMENCGIIRNPIIAGSVNFDAVNSVNLHGILFSYE